MTYKDFLKQIDEFYTIDSCIQISKENLSINWELYMKAINDCYISITSMKDIVTGELLYYIRILKKPNLAPPLNKFSTMEPVTEEEVRLYFGD